MKKISAVIGFAIVLFACSKKHSVDPESSNSVLVNGTTYPTVTIGSQVWTTLNYNGPGGYHSVDFNQYGDYYTRSQALIIKLPSGWRIPTIADYETLIRHYSPLTDIDGRPYADQMRVVPLISTTGWSSNNGTNESGFNSAPAGYFVITPSQTSYAVADAFYVTADSIGPSGNKSGRYGCLINPYTATAAQTNNPPVVRSLSLRLVKDK